MTALILITLMLLRNALAIVELDCSDNATCIESMAKDIVRSLRQQKSVKVFDFLTIEPLSTREARSTDGWLTKFLESHAFSFDWNDYTFRISQPDDLSNVLDLEVYQGRTAKDVSDPNAKKSSSKSEEDDEEDKMHAQTKLRKPKKKPKKKKVMQVILPLLFGMKSSGMVMFAFTMVAALTLKAFVASKMALLVTAGMALKKLYETYGSGIGLQNHPYLYSQYPIDFPSAPSHAYSGSGVSQQFASPEMYSPTAMGTNPHTNEILHQNDASAQQSQQAPTLLINNTRAAERWDGKSKLQQLFEPIVSRLKNVMSPITDALYGAMPATFRGLNSDVSTAKIIENESEVERKPKEILVAQPRNYVQRKIATRKIKNRPKKYTELRVSLDRLKGNKDLHDYIKTKKYKHNYPNTNFYPRIKYFVNPNSFYKPNNSRLFPYKKESKTAVNITSSFPITNNSDWLPIIPLNKTIPKVNLSKGSKNMNAKKIHRRKHVRTKRSIDNNDSYNVTERLYSQGAARGFFDLLQFLFTADPYDSVMNFTDDYNSNLLRNRRKSEPEYYSVAHQLLIIGLDIIDGISQIHDAFTSPEPRRRKKIKRKQTTKCSDRSKN